MVVALLAFAFAAAFTGAAVYVNIAEHPARLTLDDRAALAQWKPSYQGGAVMQASLALAATLLGLLMWWQTGLLAWLIGACLILAPWPYTLIVIMPVNNRLKATEPDKAGPESRALLVRWGRLHAGRSALGFAASLAYLWALV
jgi:hypothetical protein